jgi:hypothetical protein
MEFSNLPTSIDITLYKYNYIDNQLWARLYNEVDHIKVDDDSILVHAGLLVDLLQKYYEPMLRKIGAVSLDFLHKEANTIYFLIRIMQEMDRLVFIKFTRSYKKKFSRMIEDEEQKMLRFDYKVLTITFRLAEFFTNSELNVVNKYLFKQGILDEDVPFSSYKLSDFLNTVDKIIETSEEDMIAGDLFSGILDIIDPRVESDNPVVLLVTDY